MAEWVTYLSAQGSNERNFSNSEERMWACVTTDKMLTHFALQFGAMLSLPPGKQTSGFYRTLPAYPVTLHQTNSTNHSHYTGKAEKEMPGPHSKRMCDREQGVEGERGTEQMWRGDFKKARRLLGIHTSCSPQHWHPPRIRLLLFLTLQTHTFQTQPTCYISSPQSWTGSLWCSINQLKG